MPYICVHTNVSLPKEKKDFIKSEFGRLLPLISGKLEAGLMVEFVDGVTMYKAGDDTTPCAMVDMRCFKKASYQDNKNFTEAALAMLCNELGAEPTRVYLSIMEFDNWGTGGTLKQ